MIPDARTLAGQAPDGPLLLAFSGGLDSTVLLHLLTRAGLGPRLRVVHINHRLQADSDHWAACCRERVTALGLAFEMVTVAVDTGKGMEAGAREARYRALESLADGATVVTAHHRDDQAETLLLHLLRGTGVAGLGAMRPLHRRGTLQIWRPLLASRRDELLALAERRQLQWIEDPSNRDLAPRRNFLRHRVLPLLAERWPAVVETLARNARHLEEAGWLLDERAEEDAEAVARGETLKVAPLLALSGPRRRNLLRWWLRREASQAPSAAVLAQIEDLLAAPADRQARVEWGGWQLRRFQGQLYRLRLSALAPLRGEQAWQSEQGACQLGAWQLRPGTGAVPVPVPPGRLILRPFRGGERLRRNGMHQQVSELWRAAGVPPWQRRQWPLLYRDEELVCVPGVGLADSVAPQDCQLWHLSPIEAIAD
ncbi:cell cycle protein MesJ [Alcanivorax hongdengensis A-11-3]|uniref:tRNA(Ile)-lysidine synthase n=1 Tax=Alcanivorax hongdengensis A-11-3 TaxID=1177179 RepID=L0WDL4_9GAMM|nr:tRNA lysidine(34) synthetase TilS [Alcanivorax hongdengensis]EKF75121.1 cell cycle protein MesJ [Alcanivorax hongdengensis A-11-3]